MEAGEVKYPGELDQLLHRIEEQTGSMGRLVEALLLARLDQQQGLWSATQWTRCTPAASVGTWTVAAWAPDC